LVAIEIALPDPVELVRQAIASDLDPSVFTERNFTVAKNSIEFCSSHKFLNASDPLWPRQFQVLARFFEDVCYFCSDVDYVYNVPVDDSLQNVQDRFCLLEHGVCPKCRRNRLEVLAEWQHDLRYAKYHNWDEAVTLRGRPPNEFNGIWGQRSGKSYAVATFFWPYILHRYLAIPNITSYLRLASNTVLEAVFVSPILEQLKSALWTPFTNQFDASPWFREFVQFCKDEESRVGVQLYGRGQTYIAFPAKRLSIQMRAASSSTLRGGTRIFTACDELGWFNINSETGQKRSGIKDGAEVFTALDRSLLTVRSKAEQRRKQLGDFDTVDGYMFCISSPSSISDAIEQRAAVAHKSPLMMHTRYPTWQVHPEISEELVRDITAGDMVKFTRDYGAEPPRAASPFMEAGPYMKELVDHVHTKRNLFTYDIKAKEEHDTGITLLRPTLIKKLTDKVVPRVLTVDNGEKSNSFALCLASYYPEHDGVLLEEFLEVAPYQHHQVDLQWCYDELIVPLVRSFNILQVIYDRWESSYAVRDLRTNYKVDADRYSLGWKDFELFRESVRGSRIWFPVPEVEPDELLLTNNLVERARSPRAHFQVQLTTVNQFGKRVTKPENGNDDLFRCAVLAHWAISNNKDQYRRGLHGRRGGESRRVAFSTAGGRHGGAARRPGGRGRSGGQHARRRF